MLIEGEDNDDDGGRDEAWGGYEPAIVPTDVMGIVDNPYTALVPCSRWVYESTARDGLERIVVEVSNDKR